MKKLATAITAATVLFAGSAMAAEFNDFDLDKDGFISKSEASLSESLASILIS